MRLTRRNLLNTTVQIASLSSLSRLEADEVSTISPADPGTLLTGILAAYQQGKAKVVIPKGTYKFTALPFHGGALLPFSGLHNFEIYGEGVTILCPPGGDLIAFYNCKHVTLTGLELRRDPIPFPQGKITSISPSRTSYDVRIDRGYPGLDQANEGAQPVGYLFSRTNRQWKPGSQDYYSQSVEHLDGSEYRVHMGSPLGLEIEVGDLIAYRGPGGREIYLGGCESMRILDVSIKSGSGFCVHEDGGEGHHYYRYSVTYGPRPPGAGEDPLIASNADSFHSSGVRNGPTLKGCHFEGMCDDGIPIHGSYALCCEANGKSIIITSHNFRIGDPIRLYNATFGYLGEAKVTAIAAKPHYKTSQKSSYRGFADLSKEAFQEIQIDAEFPTLTFDCLLSNPAANGSGYIVHGCSVRNHRARGMLLKADHGLVENCIVDGSTIDGIVISPEVWWNEADYSHNLVIRNNIVSHVGYATAGEGTDQCGAITLVGEGTLGPGGPGHRHILFENNTIENCNGINMLIHSGGDVTVRNNLFLNAQQEPSQRGSAMFDTTSLIVVAMSDGVVLEGNRVQRRGKAGKSMITVMDTAKNVTGTSNGVKLI